MPSITRSAARAYFARWAEVEELKRAELRNTSMETKLRHLAALVDSRHLFGAERGREKGVREVRARWAQLRKALGG